MEDKKLLRRLQKGDTAALSALIDRYARYTAAIVRNIIGVSMGEEDVEEVVSDVFYVLWEQAERIEPGNLKGYLSRVARNKAVNKLRERGEEMPLEDDVILSGGEEPERIFSDKEQRAALQTALLAMGQPDREIFLRHYYYCQCVADIGEAMGMNLSTVKSRLARGRKKLKTLLLEGGHFDENQ